MSYSFELTYQSDESAMAWAKAPRRDDPNGPLLIVGLVGIHRLEGSFRDYLGVPPFVTGNRVDRLEIELQALRVEVRAHWRQK
jgi:hypothetical protein